MMFAQTLSRRSFSKLLGAGTLGSLTIGGRGLARSTPLIDETNVANSTTVADARAAAIVRLSSNENPYGPSPAALKAMTENFGLAWRYPDEHADMLVAELATMNNVPVEQILLGDGSGEILKLSAATFTSKNKKLVVANPTFEAIARHAGVAGAEVVKIDLTTDYRHDLQKMLAACNGAGLVYICNPNNPTASITPKNELADFIGKVPATTIVLVDEAYHHYVDSKDYESVMPMVKEHPNLILARTFSKVYGMAG